MENPLLKVSDLKKHFFTRTGFRKIQILKAVDGISFELGKSEVLGLVGESGCGKTTLGRTILRLYPPTSGRILFEGMDLTALPERKMRELRRGMQIVFQDPYSSLNPRLTIGKMLNQILRCHGVKNARERSIQCAMVMEKVGLETAHLSRFPHEFSGGQRQRIALARALILNPSLIVADEPTSALDMSIQAQILNLMKSLQQEFRNSYLFITHNLSAARFICDRIAVMYLGKIVEMASVKMLYEEPAHPYTKALLNLCPLPDPASAVDKITLHGEIPSPTAPPPGCRFHPRCLQKEDICEKTEPEIRNLEDGRQVACHLFRKNTEEALALMSP